MVRKLKLAREWAGNGSSRTVANGARNWAHCTTLYLHIFRLFALGVCPFSDKSVCAFYYGHEQRDICMYIYIAAYLHMFINKYI